MSQVLLTPFLDSRGRVIRLGRKIGSGGEGDVYELLSPPGPFVAKIYRKPLEERKQEKLLLMVRGCNDELKAISAWPTEVLYEKNGGPVVGFLMPRIADGEPVHKVYGPTHRKETFPHADWRFLVRTAKNLAAAFYVIHKYGYVIGDVNEGNILVTDKACVRLIDCDSFQVRSPDQLFCCEVGVAHFTPPEIQKSGNFRLERTSNHDNFGLAILIFQLLFLGRHPYAGVYAGKEDMPIEKAIAEFRFAYSRNSAKRSITPPPNSVGLAIVPDRLGELFERAFAEAGTLPRGRPSAGDWWDLLDPLEGRLRRCTADSVHHYYAGLSACPWCRLEEDSGVLLFLSADSITKIDLQREWRKVEAVTAPGPIPAVSPAMYRPFPTPLPIPLRRSLEFRKARQGGAIALAAGSIFLALAGMVADPVTLAPFLVVAAALFFFPGKADAEWKKRQGNLETARYMWRIWEKKWQEEAGDAAFTAKLGRLHQLRQKYEAIEHQYRNGILALEGSQRERQLHQFLKRYRIAAVGFPRIGGIQLESMRGAGIETAADIAPLALRRIPRLDNTQINDLLLWRAKLEGGFLFDPGKGISEPDLRALVHKYQPLMKPVERELVQGIRRLPHLREEIVRKRGLLRPAVEKRAQELAQAASDYQVFEGLPEESIRDLLGSLLPDRRGA